MSVIPPALQLHAGDRVTSKVSEDKKKEGPGLGLKPFKPEQLLVAVSKLILP